MPDIIALCPDSGRWDLFRGRPHIPLSLIHAFSLAAEEFDITVIDLRTESAW
jgi:hypothetical protein